MASGSYRAYIKPFNDDGSYADYIDVSNDVDFENVGSIKTDFDSNEYGVGTYKTSSFPIAMKNNDGKYSDIDASNSIFRFKRGGSLFKLTWRFGEDDFQAGIGVADSGQPLSEEVDLFIGILNDESARFDVASQRIQFQILGRESIFQKAIVPFSSISNGDLLSEVIYACLNQAAITELLTVDQGNIVCGIDAAIDSIAPLENKTVEDSIKLLLENSNSVLYIDGDTLKVCARTPTAEVQYNFYGQGSVSGIENVDAVSNESNGLSRTFNFWTYEESSVTSEDSASILQYGYRRAERSSDFLTDPSKLSALLDSFRDEFSQPRQEFELLTRLNYSTLALKLLDRISVDYPYLPVEDPNANLPLWGHAEYGVALAGMIVQAFFVLPDDHYKIIGKTVDVKNQKVKLRLRLI